MARFEDVHRAWLTPDRGLRLGEPWNVALREPMAAVSNFPETAGPDIKVVQFIAVRTGALKPATLADRALIADWERRHRETPDDWFGLPAALRGKP